MNPNQQSRAVAATLMGALVFIAGCGSAAEPVAEVPTNTVSTTTRAGAPSMLRPAPVPLSSLEVSADAVRQAINAYVLMWQAYAMAAATSDHEASVLSRHAADQALREIRGWLFLDRIAGVISLGRPEPSPQVVRIRVPDLPIEVHLADCHDPATWVRYKTDGGTATARTPAGKRHLAATVRIERGEWRVTTLMLGESGTC